MSTYVYEAVDPLGARVRGTLDAANESELDELLRARELVLLRARGGRASSRSRASARTLVDFCYHLGTSLRAGVPLLEALRDLREDGQSAISGEIDDMVAQIESGRLLSESMGSHPRLFSELVRALVAAGEESGELDRILLELSGYLEWREELRRRVVSAVTYPCIVVVGLIALVGIVWIYVLPRFLDLFAELNVELPLSTRVLIALQGWTQHYGGAVVLGVALGVVVLALAFRSARLRPSIDAALLRMPVAGRIVLMLEMSRFAKNLGLLYGAGVPVMRAMELIEAIAQNRAVRGTLRDARRQLDRGQPLSEALAGGDLVPRMVRRMISLGEGSGNLEDALGHVSRYYDREVPVLIDRALAFVNTGVLLGLGGTLGTVAFSIFVPLYRMMGNLNA